jgi:hypothetical protein
VLLQQPASGLTELAVIVGSPDTLDQLLAAADSARGGFGGPKKGGLASGSGLGSGSAAGGVGPERVLWFLVLHQPGPLDEPAADTAASAAAAAVIGEWACGEQGMYVVRGRKICVQACGAVAACDLRQMTCSYAFICL